MSTPEPRPSGQAKPNDGWHSRIDSLVMKIADELHRVRYLVCMVDCTYVKPGWRQIRPAHRKLPANHGVLPVARCNHNSHVFPFSLFCDTRESSLYKFDFPAYSGARPPDAPKFALAAI